VTSAEIDRLLETFRRKYTPDAVLPPETVRLWNEQFRDTHRDIMRPAAKACLDNETSFPKPARLRWYIQAAANAVENPTPRPRRDPETCDPRCDRGWIDSEEKDTVIASRPTLDPMTGRLDGPPESYEFTYPAGLYPCPTCEKAKYDRWHDKWVPHALSNRPVKTPDLLPANPVKGLASARAALAAADNLTKDANSL
jgi:hypothetical protein